MPQLNNYLDLLESLAAFVVLSVAAFGLGRPLLRHFRSLQDDYLSVCVWSMAVGLLYGASALLFAGSIGWLYASVVAGLTLAGCLWATVELTCDYFERFGSRIVSLDSAIPASEATEPLPAGWAWVVALAGAAIIASFVAALAPPKSNVALSHSLDVPKNLLLTHGVPLADIADRPLPNLAQMCLLWALALDGPVAANLVHWGLGVLTALATILLARPLLGTPAALLAGCLVLVCPGVNFAMGSAQEDLTSALFATLALAAACQVSLQLERDEWPLLGGLATGGAIATSPNGVLLLVAIAAVWCYESWKRPQRRQELVRTGCRMALVASAIAGPWLLASRPWIGPDPQQSLVAVVRHLGPFALLAPAGWLLARRLRGLNQIVLVAIVVAALAAFIPGSGRWWSLLVAPLCIASVWSWRELARLPRLAFAAAHAGLAVLAAALLTGCFDIASDAGAVALGLESRDEYLRQHVPIYPAASLVNQMLAPGQSVYCQDSRTFYFACPTVLASRQRGDSFPAGDAPDERLLATRAKRAGCSYLLLSENVDSASVEPVRAAASDNPTADMPDTAMGAEANVEVIPIREYRIADDNNRYIRYKLLRIR